MTGALMYDRRYRETFEKVQQMFSELTRENDAAGVQWAVDCLALVAEAYIQELNARQHAAVN